jgi:hypothetical protein
MKNKLNALLTCGIIVSLVLSIGDAYSAHPFIGTVAFTSFLWMMVIIIVINTD